jgi:hypothetical protein
MSMQQTIITALLTNLGNISVANGYSFNISGHVFEWQDTDLAESETDAIEVRDISNYLSEGDEQEHDLTVQITLVCAGNTSPANLRARIQDVLTAFALVENVSKVTGARLLGVDVDTEKRKKRIMEAVFRFSITYYTEIWEI